MFDCLTIQQSLRSEMIQFSLQCFSLLTRYSSCLLPPSSQSTKGKRVHEAAPDPKHSKWTNTVFPAECCRRPEASPVKISSSAVQIAPLCFYFWNLWTQRKQLGVLQRWEPGCLFGEEIVGANSEDKQSRGEMGLYLHLFIISLLAGQTLRSPWRKASDSFHKKCSTLQKQMKEFELPAESLNVSRDQ